VQRRRGLPPPVAIPYPRVIRIALAPWQTFRTWRTLVLELTALDHTTTQVVPTAQAPNQAPPRPAVAVPQAGPARLPGPPAPAAAPPPSAVADEHSSVADDWHPDQGEQGDQSEQGGEQRQDRRSIDPRVLRLARYLMGAPDADEVTGEMVGPLLGIEVAPRTGRRLLGQARELVQAEAGDQRVLELSAPGGR
ncbi:MAG TPA: hypothetical protein VH008_06300, partial [Pseudonocardia sp.]|nr:hypothetical protein [Pseudonocardia sp.]